MDLILGLKMHVGGISVGSNCYRLRKAGPERVARAVLQVCGSSAFDYGRPRIYRSGPHFFGRAVPPGRGLLVEVQPLTPLRGKVIPQNQNFHSVRLTAVDSSIGGLPDVTVDEIVATRG